MTERKQTFTRAIVLGMGFTESGDKPTGIGQLWDRLHREFNNGSTRILTPYQWNDDATGAARFLNRHLDRPDYDIIYVGYSYGGGVFFPRFARALELEGRKISHAILIDPVERFGLGWWWRHIELPRNVIKATVYHQREDWPCGFAVRPRLPEQHITGPIKLDYQHTDIDAAQVIHQRVIGVVGDHIRQGYTVTQATRVDG